MRWRRWMLYGVGSLLGLAVLFVIAWMIAIGPVAVWRVVTHGTTTVWDHLEYPGRELSPSPEPEPWPTAIGDVPSVDLDGVSIALPDLLKTHDALSMVIVRDGAIVYEWHASGHEPGTPSMLFSASKSITSLMIGAAIQDGLIGSVEDPITNYLPELAERGFAGVTIADALQMDTGSTYVEGDNPFGIHVELNYTDDLESRILGLSADDRRGMGEFTYKSGDNALLGLILHRVLAGESITEYLQTRFLDPLGTQDGGKWSTDDDGGLERTWCCLALSARDLARFGQFVLDGGVAGGEQIVPEAWLARSFTPHYGTDRWPEDYDGSPLVDYGYQWWLVDGGAVLAYGKDGQYLYVDPARRLVIVRTGTSQGGIGWVDLLVQIADGFPLGEG